MAYTREEFIEALALGRPQEKQYFNDICQQTGLDPSADFEQVVDETLHYINSMEEECYFEDDMDGDHTSAFASIGWGTDEDYDPGEMI